MSKQTKIGSGLTAVYSGVSDGKKIYRVHEASFGNTMFTGTMGQVKRWVKIHAEKAQRSLNKIGQNRSKFEATIYKISSSRRPKVI